MIVKTVGAGVGIAVLVGRLMRRGVSVGWIVDGVSGVSVGGGEDSTATKVCWQAVPNMSMINHNRRFFI